MAEPEATNDSNDSEGDIDPLEDPFADRQDSSTDESVYTALESLETPQEPLGRRHRTRQLSTTARKNLEQSGSVYRSALYYKARQSKPAEPGSAGPAEPINPLEILPMTKATFIARYIARIHQKDLLPKPRDWKDIIKHPYKAEWFQTAKVE